MENRMLYLGEEKISKLLWQFSLPSIISTLGSSIYIIIDRIFIGKVVGADAISGISITMPISLIMLAFGALVAFGSGTLVSIRLGENEIHEAEVILGNAITLVFIISIVMTCISLFFLERLLIMFGGSPAILPYARDFIRIILLGSGFQFIIISLPAIIRAEGNPRIAMNILLINVGTNIVLDFVFIYGLGWAVKGAAAATVISQMVSSCLVFRYFFSSNSLLRLRLKNMRMRLKVVKGVAAVGMAPFAMQLAASVINLLYNQELARYGGDISIAAYGIIYSIVVFLVLPVSGINMGMQPIIGFNFGARNYDRVIETLEHAITAAIMITSVGFIVLQLFPGQLLSFFTEDTDLIAIGSHGMRLITIMLPFVGFQMVGSSFFQAIGKTRTALVLTLLRQVIILIPALIILPRFFQLNGVWIAAPIADGLAVLITMAVLKSGTRLLRSRMNILPI